MLASNFLAFICCKIPTPFQRMQLQHKTTALTVDRIRMFSAVGESSPAAALDHEMPIDATSDTAAAATGPVEYDSTKLRSLPMKAAQTTSVDSDAEAVERLLQCPLTKVSAVFEPA